MLSSLIRFTVALVLASFTLCAAIPITTTSTAATPIYDVSTPYYPSGEPIPEGTYLSEGGLAPARRDGELWMGREHQEVGEAGVLGRRSGELWFGREHEEVARADLARRTGDLWRGLEHEEVSPSDI